MMSERSENAIAFVKREYGHNVLAESYPDQYDSFERYLIVARAGYDPRRFCASDVATIKEVKSEIEGYADDGWTCQAFDLDQDVRVEFFIYHTVEIDSHDDED